MLRKTTGKDMRIELLAANESDARTAAANEGMLITECKVLDQKKPVPLNRNEAYLRESVMWLRFLGISTALGAFALVLKMIMTH